MKIIVGVLLGLLVGSAFGTPIVLRGPNFYYGTYEVVLERPFLDEGISGQEELSARLKAYNSADSLRIYEEMAKERILVDLGDEHNTIAISAPTLLKAFEFPVDKVEWDRPITYPKNQRLRFIFTLFSNRQRPQTLFHVRGPEVSIRQITTYATESSILQRTDLLKTFVPRGDFTIHLEEFSTPHLVMGPMDEQTLNEYVYAIDMAKRRPRLVLDIVLGLEFTHLAEKKLAQGTFTSWKQNVSLLEKEGVLLELNCFRKFTP